MPYPNEHSCKLLANAKFSDVISKEETINNKKVRILLGRNNKDEDYKVMSIRFNKQIWTEEEAKKVCADKGGTFEPALKEPKQEQTQKQEQKQEQKQNNSTSSPSTFSNFINGYYVINPQLLSYLNENLAIKNYTFETIYSKKLRPDLAHIKVQGILEPNPSLISVLSGQSCCTKSLFQELIQLKYDKDVKTILFELDSEGGKIDYLEDIIDVCKELKNQGKTLLAFVNNKALSGAYWIASVCNKIYCNKSSLLGSIGAVYIHYDISEKLKKDGINITSFAVGRYKLLGASFNTLKDEDKAIIDKNLNEIYTKFVSTVKSNRNITDNNVFEANVYYGTEAISLGLADDFNNIYEFLINFNNQEQDIKNNKNTSNINSNIKEIIEVAYKYNLDSNIVMKAIDKGMSVESFCYNLLKNNIINIKPQIKDNVEIKDNIETRMVSNLLDINQQQTNINMKAFEEGLKL